MQYAPMTDASNIIKALGDYVKVAEALGIPEGTVAAWKSRNSIPPSQWVSIVNLAKKRRVMSITYALLASLRVRKEAV